jgi:hypothetical protein
MSSTRTVLGAGLAHREVGLDQAALQESHLGAELLPHPGEEALAAEALLRLLVAALDLVPLGARRHPQDLVGVLLGEALVGLHDRLLLEALQRQQVGVVAKDGRHLERPFGHGRVVGEHPSTSMP